MDLNAICSKVPHEPMAVKCWARVSSLDLSKFLCIYMRTFRWIATATALLID